MSAFNSRLSQLRGVGTNFIPFFRIVSSDSLNISPERLNTVGVTSEASKPPKSSKNCVRFVLEVVDETDPCPKDPVGMTSDEEGSIKKERLDCLQLAGCQQLVMVETVQG